MCKLSFSLFAIWFIFSGCNKTIELELPKIIEKPVVNCLFQEGEYLNVHLSLPKSPKDITNNIITNAIVQIKDEKNEITELRYIENGFYCDSLFLPLRGIEYTITINIPGFKEVSAVGKIPKNQVEIQTIHSKSDIISEPVMGSGEEAIINVQKVVINFNHAMDFKDFMGISTKLHPVSHSYINGDVIANEKKDIIRYGYLRSNDPSFLNEGLESYFESSILLFKDELFNTEEAKVQFNFEKETASKYWLQFYQFSPEAFNYLRSYIIHDYTKEYDFWEAYEPLPMYSNIENGYGIFAGYSSSTYEIQPDTTITF